MIFSSILLPLTPCIFLTKIAPKRPGSRNNLFPHNYNVAPLSKSERVELSPSCKRIHMNRTKLSPWKNHPISTLLFSSEGQLTTAEVNYSCTLMRWPIELKCRPLLSVRLLLKYYIKSNKTETEISSKYQIVRFLKSIALDRVGERCSGNL